jgi:hypothetical protein
MTSVAGLPQAIKEGYKRTSTATTKGAFPGERTDLQGVLVDKVSHGTLFSQHSAPGTAARAAGPKTPSSMPAVDVRRDPSPGGETGYPAPGVTR